MPTLREADMKMWTWLIDDYERGTAFITDDLAKSQRAIVSALTVEQAHQVVEAHNAEIANDAMGGGAGRADVVVHGGSGGHHP